MRQPRVRRGPGSSADVWPMSGGRGGGENRQGFTAGGNREVCPAALLGARGDLRAALPEAHPSAACPEGRPPRSGVPLPVHAFVAFTTSTVITSALTVISAGASRSLASTRAVLFAALPAKTRYPIASAFMDAISTAPAAMSLASFAIGSKAV